MFSTETLILFLSYLNFLGFLQSCVCFQIEYQLRQKWQIGVTVNFETK
jgi:hypothetical protein